MRKHNVSIIFRSSCFLSNLVKWATLNMAEQTRQLPSEIIYCLLKGIFVFFLGIVCSTVHVKNCPFRSPISWPSHKSKTLYRLVKRATGYDVIDLKWANIWIFVMEYLPSTFNLSSPTNIPWVLGKHCLPSTNGIYLLSKLYQLCKTCESANVSHYSQNISMCKCDGPLHIPLIARFSRIRLYDREKRLA